MHHSRSTCRVLDALEAVNVTGIGMLRDQLGEFTKGLATGSRSAGWLLALRHWDGTPTDVEFGSLTDHLAPYARYRYKVDEAADSFLPSLSMFLHVPSTTSQHIAFELVQDGGSRKAE